MYCVLELENVIQEYCYVHHILNCISMFQCTILLLLSDDGSGVDEIRKRVI